MEDPFHLQRFVEAQADTYAEALKEIRAGAKRSHWMWFIFPQMAGLGTSEISRRYAIKDLDEARAYITHPVLGARLIQCADAVVAHRSRSLEEIFGAVDALKFRSSMTLFEAAGPGNESIRRALETKCGNCRDSMTLTLLVRR